MMHISLDLLYVEKKADQLKSRGSSTSGNPQRIPNSWEGAFRNYPYITSHSQSKVQKAAMRLT